ncbi:uncharacterized protein Dyak_GE29134, partial [Drosophila yakuba]
MGPEYHLNTIQGVKKRESIVASLEIKSEKLKDTLTSLEQELYSSNQKIAQLENALNEVHRNAEEVAQSSVFEMYDQMEVRYQESSLLVDQLTQSKAQLEQQVAELQEDVASKLVSNQKTSSLVEQLTQSKAQLEQQVAALQKEVASQQISNQHSGPMIKQLSDSIQNLERVNAKLSEDNSVSQTARLDMSETPLKTDNELKRRINRVVHLEASERRMTNELSACKREMNELKKELKSSEERIYMMKE